MNDLPWTHKVLRTGMRYAALVLIILGSSVSGQNAANLIENGDAEEGARHRWKGSSVEVVTNDVHGGAYAFKTAPGEKVRFLSARLIPVEKKSTYVLSGWFKSVGYEPNSLHFGYIPYDSSKTRILPQYVNVYPDTGTRLVRPCEKSSNVIAIQDGAQWTADPFACVAFDVDDSGQYRDLPNGNVSPLGIDSIEQKGTYWLVTLSKPCGFDYPANTALREHRSGESWIFSAAKGRKIPLRQWVHFTGNITGMSDNGLSRLSWWRGTKYVQVAIMAPAGGEFVFDDITMYVGGAD